ncbi:MAG: bifunctional phosphopantothenoylcysteine decarboxylase/phosphopantothenate--cysteine ligase CoaBC [bacterium]|jgi:phosphopantothenoylcysteine decarboxylase/phosphopantothenate--cysteine ligase
MTQGREILRGKTILFGVTGGIAAYKAVDVVSQLRKAGSEVLVIMTAAATRLVSPLTFQTLSHNPVYTDMWAEPKRWAVEHIALAERADIFMIVPATANIIGKIAGGIADDLLATTVMATQAPVLIAPAMNVNMYENPITQTNLRKLVGLGYHIIEPDTGILASGASGKGRLPETAVLVDAAVRLLGASADFTGKRVLVTAGPTREAIDPVRHLSNPSTGKMGYAVAEAARDRGAHVVLISGPTHLPAPAGVETMQIKSAVDMYNAVIANYEAADIIIKSAAVSDYRPVRAAAEKIKKSEGKMIIELERNPDILYELGQRKGDRILVGFAAETNDVLANAVAKYRKKNLDLIVANDVTQEGAGFAGDTNIVSIIDREGNVEALPQLTKRQVAEKLLDRVRELMK